MTQSTSFHFDFIYLLLTILIHLILVIVVRTFYRFSIIKKYHYDYFDAQRSSNAFKKFGHHLVIMAKKPSNLVYVGLFLLVEFGFYYLVS